MAKSALITGITGQDGSYLAELLLSKGYKVYGLIRRSSTVTVERLTSILDQITLLPGDLLDQNSIMRALELSEPDEVYNLAAQSFVATSWDQAVLTGEVTALGTTRLLEAIRWSNPRIRFYQASSSEMFGSSAAPQNEVTAFHPRSPYACAKVYAHYTTQNYRESYGIFACSGILFNHESPRRGLEFVTRKVSDAVAKIKLGLANELVMGNLDARRDWGFAGDYVQAMWKMLQQKGPRDYVIGTGVSHSVLELVELAFRAVDLDYRKYVRTDCRFLRPAEVDCLCADCSCAREELGWTPTTPFEELVRIMVEADMERNANSPRQCGATAGN